MLFRSELMGSRYPSPDMSDDEKQAYVDDISKREGIDLTVDEIKENSGIKNLGKLCLNSLWGKLCQSLNKTKTCVLQKRFGWHT